MPAECKRLRDLLLLIHEDWTTHARDCGQPGFRAAAVYRFGVWQSSVRLPIVRPIFGRLYQCLFRYIRNHYGIEIPSTVRVGRRLRIGHQGGIVIHPCAQIGNDCLIRHNVTLGAGSDDRSWEAPILGDDVQVGCGAAILGNITVGDGARIDANAVVKSDVPPSARVFSPLARIVAEPDSRPPCNPPSKDPERKQRSPSS